MLEKLTLSGNIADLGILLNGCPLLRILSVTLCGMGLSSLNAALSALENAAPLGLTFSTLGIEIPWGDDIGMVRFTSLLCTMERLSPHELVITDNFDRCHGSHDRKIKANLPCFAHARSIKMSLRNVCFESLMPAGEFSMLERISLSRCCSFINIDTLVTRCPRLRVLKATVSSGKIMVHSPSLQELDLRWNFGTKCHVIDIVTPVLKKLHVEARAGGDIGVSIAAPMLDNVSWKSSYTGPTLVFGSWCLQSLTVETMENLMCLHLNVHVCVNLFLLNLPF
jgi:hypothetical protein